jgi:hypothetical protein
LNFEDVFLEAVEDFFENLKSFEKMRVQDVFKENIYGRDFNFNIHKFIYLCNFLRTFTDTMPLKIQSCFGNLQPSYVVPRFSLIHNRLFH